MSKAAAPKARRSGIFRYDFDTAGRGPARFGSFILIPFLLLFGAWAGLAPLNSASIANGQVVLNQNRKSVQHLEGGIIDEIYVKEGQAIQKDDPVLVIRSLPQRQQIESLYDQIAAARSLRARLVAELAGREKPDFSDLDKSIKLSKKKYAVITDMQTRLFEARKKSLQSKTSLIRSSQEQARKEIKGAQAQLKAFNKQLELVRQEFANIAPLREEGLITGAQKMGLEKSIAELEGQIGSVTENIARLEQTIIGGDLQIIDGQTELRKTALDELQKTELSLQELVHQMVSLQDQLKRTVVKAPVSGRIMDLQVHTKGAVLSPGQRILDIVPQDDRLIVEARLSPNDIDLVVPKLKAKILLSAFKAKKLPKIDGTVETISGDLLIDPASGERYYLVRVSVDQSIFKKLKSNISLYPGMPAQVFFIEGERTLADYLISPILDATYRAFREE